jgi:hypothetical protein
MRAAAEKILAAPNATPANRMMARKAMKMAGSTPAKTSSESAPEINAKR